MRTRFLVILAIVLTSLAIYIALIIVPGDDSKVKPTPETLPTIFVEGPDIKRADTGQKVIFKGATTMAFTSGYPLDNKFMSVLEAVRGWGINFIGIYVGPDILQKKIGKLDYIIDWAQRNHLYVFIFPRPINEKDELNQPDQYSEIMGTLAKRYTNMKNVLYSLGSEPNMSWEAWFDLAHKVARSINKSNPEATLIMTGTDFGRYVDFKERLPYKNIIYDFHEYPAKDIEGLVLKTSGGKYKFLWEESHKYWPILVGEFGGVWEEGFGSKEDLTFIQTILNKVNKNKLSYMAYTIDQEGELSLIDWESMEPTRKGLIIKKDLKDYPPTDFKLSK